MANSILTINMITRESVRLWHNSNAFLQNVDMQYDDSFAVSGAKIGSALRIRLPNDYTVVTGPALNVQDTSEQSTTLVLATQKHVDMAFSTADRTMKLDDYSRRVLAPAVNNLAGAVAVDIMSGVEGGICNLVANQDNTGAILNPVAGTVLRAGASLSNNSAPQGTRKLVNSPDTQSSAVATLSGLLNPQSEISRQYIYGKMYDVQYQTVGASPANGAAVNPALGMAASAEYTKNFAYAPEAVTLATADLEVPNNVAEAHRESFDKVSMRMVTDYFIGTDQLITRLDVLYGYLWIRPEWACVVADVVYGS